MDGTLHPSPALAPEISPCWGNLRMPGWHRGTWVREGGGKSDSESKGQASWQSTGAACMLLRGQSPCQWCSLGTSAHPACCGTGLGQQHHVPRRAGQLDSQPRGRVMAGREHPEVSQRYPKSIPEVSQSPWLRCPGSKEMSWFGTWAGPCGQAEMKVISQPCPGVWWLWAPHSLGLGPFYFVSPLCRSVASPWIHPLLL